jgi:hypothetical protein
MPGVDIVGDAGKFERDWFHGVDKLCEGVSNVKAPIKEFDSGGIVVLQGGLLRA